MAGYEYSVVPAPTKGVKAKGVKTPEERFAYALQTVMNEKGAEGWEYQRTDTLPAIERSGLTGSTTNWRHVLVFRRAITETDQLAEIKEEISASAPPAAPVPVVNLDPERPAGQPGATEMYADDGVEEVSDVAGVTTSLETLAETRKTPENSNV